MHDLPKRKQIRLKNYDYSQNGYYFVTICAKDKKPLFRNIEISRNVPVGADIIRPLSKNSNLTECGKIADNAINKIPKYYPNVVIDKYVIMPNHIHLILVITDNDGNRRMISAPTIARIIGQMKRYVSKMVGYSVWQKSFYEHVIRNETEYLEIWEYIESNPLV